MSIDVLNKRIRWLIGVVIFAGRRPLCDLISFALLLVILSGVTSGSTFFPPSVAVPEKLIYDLTWTGIKAGSATLEVMNDGDHVKIFSTAVSAPWVSVFYRVDNRVECTLSRTSGGTGFQPLRYRIKIREGRHRRDKEVTFAHDNTTAIYVDYLKNERKEFEINPPVFDPLSGFYRLRSLPLAVGHPTFLTIFDSKKVWNVEVQVLKKERISLPAGPVNTVLVRPLMQSEGIFSRKGDILIWLTDDDRRVPVKMQTKVAIGSVTAQIVSGL